MRDPEDETSTESGELLSGDVRDARPTVDAIAMADVRARSARALFGTNEPARVGRFVLLGPVASGGMGVVYSAYDPQLDRRIALKLMHPDPYMADRARERLLREARALAQLDHPNVVPVHDVIEIGGQVVVVMELVDGQTLTAWECAQPRSWREIVAIYLEAGRGLAAAHKLGLVHRDFKPANAIVGHDGRVRVLDFGLVHMATDQGDRPDDRVEPSDRGRSPLATATGELVGTLGFMAPEQLAGHATTPASDQFSFCVALHRALHGVPPFPGTSKETLLAGIRSGRKASATDGRRIPRWLTEVGDRGLAAEPSHRYPSMAQLLERLGREHGWRRWWPLPVTALVAVAVTSVIMVVRDPGDRDPLAACDGGAGEIGAIWNPAARDALQQRFDGITAPYARVVDDLVLGELDGYRDAWSRAHRTACRDHRRGTLSDVLFDRSMTCLDRRREGLAAAVRVLATVDAASVDRAVEVTVGMSRVDDCADRAVLLADADPPATDAARAALVALRAKLSEAEALDRAGRSAAALETAGALVVRAEQLGYPPALVEVLLVQGRILLSRNSFAEAAAPLRRAEHLALEHRLFAQAVIAAARRLYVEAMSSQPIAPLLAQAALLVPLGRGLPPDPLARPLLLNNLGVLHMANGERDLANATFVAAREAMAVIPAPDLELISIEKNLAMITADPVQREHYAHAVWDRLHSRLGETHPATLDALLSYAHFIEAPERALDPTRRACDLYREFHPDLLAQRVRCLTYLGSLTRELGRDPVAHYAEASQLTAGHATPKLRSLGLLAAGYAHLSAGDPASATAALTTALAELEPATQWWHRVHAGHFHLGLGLAAEAAHHDRDAVVHLGRAVAAFAEGVPHSEDVETRACLANSRRHLAASLRRLHGDGPRVRELEREVASYDQAGRH